MTDGVPPALLALFLAALPGCAAAPPTPVAGTGTRFVIEAGPAAGGPVYVLIEASDGQPGWLTVSGAAGGVHLRDRCEIADCGLPPGVCGASLPLVRNIGAGGTDQRIEATWDGRRSVIDTVAACERRLPAPGGSYTARFCYSTEAEFTGAGDPARGAIGRLVRPVCEERHFTLADPLVVLRVSARSGS